MSSRTVPVPRVPDPVQTVVTGVQRLAFWAAVFLPLAYLPVLSASTGQEQLLVVVGLVALNVACLLIGHDYSP